MRTADARSLSCLIAARQRHWWGERFGGIIATGSNRERVATAAAELGNGARGITADQMTTLAQETTRHVGKPDILFANAGLGHVMLVSATDALSYDAQFCVNVKGVFLTVQALAPVRGAGGSIILNASAVNRKGKADASVYFATKAAERSFTRSFADEFRPAGIRVNALNPGLVATGFQERTGTATEDFDGFVSYVSGIAPLN